MTSEKSLKNRSSFDFTQCLISEKTYLAKSNFLFEFLPLDILSDDPIFFSIIRFSWKL